MNRKKIIVLTSLLLLAVIGGTGYAAYLWQNIILLQNDNTDLSSQVSVQKSKLDEFTKTQEAAQQQGKDFAQCQADRDNLKATVEAFAKQAESCAVLKRKLHVKD